VRAEPRERSETDWPKASPTGAQSGSVSIKWSKRHSRHDDRNLLPAVFAIDPKMRVKREDAGSGMQFREPNKAGIRKRHGQVFVFVDEFPKRFPLGDYREIDLEHSRVKELKESPRPAW